MIGTTTRRTPSRRRDRPSDRLTPFVTHCLCGQAIAGERQAECQILTCPSCQAGVFVLAESPLEPCDPLTDPAAGRAAATRQREELMDPARRERRQRARQRLRWRGFRAWRNRWLAPWRRVRALFRLPVLVTMGLLATLVWTGQTQLQSFRERRVAELMEQAGRAGLEAVEQGDFERADRLFDPIREQLTLSDRRYESYAVSAREAGVMANLLLDTIDRTMTFVAQATPTHRASMLGQGVVIEGDVEFTAAGTAVLATRFFVNDRPVRIVLGSLEQAKLAGVTGPGRYLLGSRLASLTQVGSEWNLSLDPMQTIAIVHSSVLGPLGLADDKELLEMIDQQRRQRAESSGVSQGGSAP